MPKQPAWTSLDQKEKVQILLAAYQKHATELRDIEASQEKLIALVLGIYSAALTLIGVTFKQDVVTTLLRSGGKPSLALPARDVRQGGVPPRAQMPRQS